MSLIPYAMYAITHTMVTTLEGARSAVAAYTALYAAMMLIASILSMRNVRRGYFYVSADDRRVAWASFVRSTVLCVMMAAAFAIDRAFGPSWAGLELFCLVPAIRIARWIFARPPSAEALRIATTEPAASLQAS